MSRKSKIITLCLVGAVATVGMCACCSGWWDMPPHGGGGVGRGVRPGFFFWGGSSYVAGPVHTGPGPGRGANPGSSTTSRGGFGATGGAHGGSSGT